MVTQQSAIETARAFVRDCARVGLVFNKVLLFGSYANGTANENSDIDLLLVSDKFDDNVLNNLKLYSKININYPIIETHPLSLRQLQEDDEFVKQITAKSIEIK